MKKVLVVGPTWNGIGGVETLSAWVLQALASKDYQVDLFSWEEPDVGAINRTCGTSLDPSDFRWIAIPDAAKQILNVLPLRLSLLEMSLQFQACRKHLSQTSYDAVIGTLNELDVGQPLIQYVHFPWAYFPRPEVDYRWYHFQLPLLAYRQIAMWISGYSRERIGRNRTLANSEWTAERFEAWYGTPATVVYPPVPGGFPALADDQRDQSFACLGRISPEKELIKLIRILARVRERGHQVSLRIIGSPIQSSYMEQLTAAAEPHRDWVSFHLRLPRDQMVQVIARCRFGIHGMVGEHFGIAPAELQRAGCITFVPGDGGPVEIVGQDERVIYHSEDDGVDKIDRVLSDPSLAAAIRADVARRAERFTEEHFMASIRAAVDGFASR